MCKFCERIEDFAGWNQPEIEGVTGNVSKELNLKVAIHDYQTTKPKLIITSDQFFPKLIGVDGIATVYIPISYCPICGRKLGHSQSVLLNRFNEPDKNEEDIVELGDYVYAKASAEEYGFIKNHLYAILDTNCYDTITVQNENGEKT